MANERNHERTKFYESLPLAAQGVGTMSTEQVSWQKTLSVVVGIGLLIAALAGWWGALQTNGQVLGIFAFNVWNTWLALVAAVLAFGASIYNTSARAIWALLTVVYAFMFVAGLIVHGGRVIALFANNYNNVWAYAVFVIIFGYLAATRSQERAI